MERNVIMIMVKVIQGYCSIEMIKCYKLHHPKVLEGSIKVTMEHGFLSGGSGEFEMLAGNAKWLSGTCLE
jgi:hypothetical protein